MPMDSSTAVVRRFFIFRSPDGPAAAMNLGSDDVSVSAACLMGIVLSILVLYTLLVGLH